MASNMTLNPTKDHRWFFGFGNMFYKQNHQWWGTRSWLVQFLIWTADHQRHAPVFHPV